MTDIKEFTAQLSDKEWYIRRNAAIALLDAAEKGIDISQAIPSLTNALSDKAKIVRQYAAAALSTAVENGANISPAIPALGKALSSNDSVLRQNAVVALRHAAKRGLDISSVAKKLEKTSVEFEKKEEIETKEHEEIRSWRETIFGFHKLEFAKQIDLLTGLLLFVIGGLGYFLVIFLSVENIAILSDLAKATTIEDPLETIGIVLLVSIIVSIIFYVISKTLSFGLTEEVRIGEGFCSISLWSLLREDFRNIGCGSRYVYKPQNNHRAMIINCLIATLSYFVPYVIYVIFWELPGLLLFSAFRGSLSLNSLLSVDLFFALIFFYLIYVAIEKLYAVRGFKVDYISLL